MSFFHLVKFPTHFRNHINSIHCSKFLNLLHSYFDIHFGISSHASYVRTITGVELPLLTVLWIRRTFAESPPRPCRRTPPWPCFHWRYRKGAGVVMISEMLYWLNGCSSHAASLRSWAFCAQEKGKQQQSGHWCKLWSLKWSKETMD